ncbi:MAG: sulfotransferase [Gammaproteobacteria bacterium]
MTGSSTPLRVGYIAGYGRSGSTVLDIVLGQHPQLLAVGELANLSKRVWVNNEYCSCGARVRDCPFWSEVCRRFTQRFGEDALRAYAKLQARFEGLSVLTSSSVRSLRNPGGFVDYCAYTESLFAILVKASGKPVVIDSSKLPGRALTLAFIPGLDLQLIHLLRDGRGVAWSLTKAYVKDEQSGIERPLASRSVPRTAIRWATVNLATEAVVRRLDANRAMRMRYEDFVTAPAVELARVGTLLDADLRSVCTRLQTGKLFEPGHIVAGSRVRMAGTLKLKFDQDWMRLMPAPQRRVFQILCGWLQRRYGYS